MLAIIGELFQHSIMKYREKKVVDRDEHGRTVYYIRYEKTHDIPILPQKPRESWRGINPKRQRNISR
jgi:hypothetical protein